DLLGVRDASRRPDAGREERGGQQIATGSARVEHRCYVSCPLQFTLFLGQRAMILYFSRAVELKRGTRLMRAAERPGIDDGGACGLGARSSAERAQGDLRHVLVVDRHAPAVGVACNVVQGQDEAVVDIADTDLGLGQRLGMDIVPGAAQQDPVRVELEAGSAENALAAVQEPDQRLRGVVAVHYLRRPAAKGGGSFK